MIEIGHQKEIAVRRRENGKLVPVYDSLNNPVIKVVSSEVWRVTRSTLGPGYGPDSKRKLVVGLVNGDVLMLSPKGTRQSVSVELKAIYGWLLRNKALRQQLEKARKRKGVLQTRRTSRQIKRMERKLRQPIKTPKFKVHLEDKSWHHDVPENCTDCKTPTRYWLPDKHTPLCQACCAKRVSAHQGKTFKCAATPVETPACSFGNANEVLTGSIQGNADDV